MSTVDVFASNSLPYGNPDFSSLREQKMIYVDKTKIIARIAKQRAPIFFSRPRRFGKSLLINTLHCLFETGLKYFHGLEIEKNWNDRTYNVVHLDFSAFASKNSLELQADLGETIIKKFKMDGLVSQCGQAGVRSCDRILDEICEKLKNNSVVLLIDEYDAPITHQINNQNELDKIVQILNSFYATIKQYTGKFRLIFITGITRTSHTSIFSAFNNLLDLSLEDDFNSILGFTQDDLRQYFDLYIDNAAHILNMSKDDIYKRLEQYYDGFQFTLNAQETVYNPWSILSFLKVPKNGFQNYWFKSSGSSALIVQYFKKSSNFSSLHEASELCITTERLSDRFDILNIPQDILLFQAGYYTLRKKTAEIARLVFPNTEVEDSVLKLYLLANNLKPDLKFSKEIDNLPEQIDQRNLSAIVATFNDILNDCVSILSTIFNDERSVRDIIYAALPQKMTLHKIKERETVQGRSDLELLTLKTHLVIEFKRVTSCRTAQSSLNEALDQLQRKKYGVGSFQNYALYRVAMVISPQEKKILPAFCKELI